jgi:hypothetical protein
MALTDLTLNTTSIANLALSHLGMTAITDLNVDAANNNPSAVAINAHWGPCRNDVFSEFKWPFATVIEPMQVQASVSIDDYPEWSYFFVYTANAATVWNVFDSSTVKTKHENQFEVVYNPTLQKRIICCNLTWTSFAFNEYTYNVTDPTFWSPKFVMAFSYRLAASICMILTGDEKKSLFLMDLYRGFIHEAKRVSSSEKKTKPDQNNPIVNARG